MTADDPSRFCTNCGAPVGGGIRFCAACGHAVDPVDADAAATEPPAATDPPAATEPPAAVDPVPAAGPPPEPPAPVDPVPAAGPPSEPPAGRKGVPAWLWPVVAAAVIVALVVGVVVATTGGDSSDTAEAGGEIFLEPAGSHGTDPFTDANLEGPVVSTTQASTTSTTTTLPAREASGTTAVVAESGGTPGLYGGTGSQSRCDREQMIVFLQANPSQAAAFVAALNADPTLRWSGGTRVTVAQIPQYLRELTPITLVRDTRVTNHGYRNGSPTPLQSVLQAGTAVMVDSYGVPRVRCACGNPLTPPVPVTEKPVYEGNPWPGWNPGTVVVVNQSTTIIDIFVLIDINTGELVNRPAGTDGREDTPAGATTPTTTTRPTTTTTPTTTTAPAGPTGVSGTYTFSSEVAAGSNAQCTGNSGDITVTEQGSGASRTVRFASGSDALEGALSADGSFDVSAPFGDGAGTQTLTGRFVTSGGTTTATGTGTINAEDVSCNLNFTAQRVS